MEDIHQAHQTITFCGIGAHHQNGIAKCCICDITESACTSLLHAAHQWPKTTTANLWLQALKHATNIYNALPHAGKPSYPLYLFSRTHVQLNIKHFHPFGCLVYVLQAPLQNQNLFPKLGERSYVSIFLCHSPHHAASIPLVLSTQTGLVSPQFHCIFGDDFDTVKKEQHDTSIWQRKAHLQATQDKLQAATVNVMPVTQPTLTKTSLLPNYGANIPTTLQQLPELLEQATMTHFF